MKPEDIKMGQLYKVNCSTGRSIVTVKITGPRGDEGSNIDPAFHNVCPGTGVICPRGKKCYSMLSEIVSLASTVNILGNFPKKSTTKGACHA
jgi:hypothetical protein